MVVLDIIILVVGFIALIKGADIFVEGSSALAKNFKVPGVIIGLTIVALGTSAPELAVSTSAAMQGANEIALSNVIGSNIFNLLAVLGVCALIHSVPVDDDILKRDFPISIITTLIVLSMTSFGSTLTGIEMSDNVGDITRTIGIVLIFVFVSYIMILIVNAKKHTQGEDDIKQIPLRKCFLYIIIGIALIIAGGQAVVYSAKEIARIAGMSETLIGLTIVAVGTSLPELVTSIVASRKGENGMAVGNVIGSNIFNLLFILGVSSAIHPIQVNLASVYDMIILIAVSVITYLFVIKDRKLGRIEGVAMLFIYIADMIFAAVR
ncbi:MAG: calcium/sodium antiporter [Firmicutes bacterium]|nr:calcium/sodium antiporter [Bacillota bacterium]